jgi:hypothetical protein
MTYAPNGNLLHVIMDPSSMQNLVWHSGNAQNYFVTPQNTAQYSERSAAVVARSTAETKVVQGKNCTKVIAKADGKDIEIWLDASVNFDFGSYAIFAYEFDVLLALDKAGVSGLPVEATIKDAVGNELASWSVSSVNQRNVSETEMAPPAGYEEFVNSEK